MYPDCVSEATELSFFALPPGSSAKSNWGPVVFCDSDRRRRRVPSPSEGKKEKKSEAEEPTEQSAQSKVKQREKVCRKTIRSIGGQTNDRRLSLAYRAGDRRERHPFEDRLPSRRPIINHQPSAIDVVGKATRGKRETPRTVGCRTKRKQNTYIGEKKQRWRCRPREKRHKKKDGDKKKRKKKPARARVPVTRVYRLRRRTETGEIVCHNTSVVLIE